MELSEIFQNGDLSKKMVSSVIFAISLLAIRFITIRSLNKSQINFEGGRRYWIVKVKTTFLFVFFLGLAIIWANAIQSFAVSLVAVAAAVVIAFKEIILNFAGYFARASGKPCSIGDRIEVNGMRGDIVDQNLFYVKVLEIGPGNVIHQYTGRSISFPNSVFLGVSCTPIINESFTEKYSLHVFKISVKLTKRLEDLQNKLLEICNKSCAEYLSDAEKVFKNFGQEEGLDAPSVNPRVVIHLVDSEVAQFVVRVPAPLKRKGKVEQEIVKEFTKEYVLILPD